MSSNRGRTASSVGMMEGAFFVSRTDLLQWVNRLLAVNLTKVEQCASGSIYCQIIDSCCPGSVKMSKLNWMARSDHEYIPNYKVLQAALDKNGIEKHINVDSLIRAKYQDNLEMLQWMKCYWEHEGTGRQDYDSVKAREGKPLPPWAKPLGAPGGAPPVPGAPVRAELGQKENTSVNRDAAPEKKFSPVARKPAAAAAPKVGGVPASASTTPKAGASTTPKAAPAVAVKRPGSSKPGPVLGSASLQASHAEMKMLVADQADEIQELRDALDGLENERDYYFRKLRDIEVLCSTLQADAESVADAPGIIKDVQAILYAENDDEEEQEAASLGPASQEPGVLVA